MNRKIVIFICFASVIALGVLVIRPEYREYKKLKLESAQKEIEYSYHQEYFIELADIDSKLKERKSSIEKVKHAFPDDFSIPAFCANMQKMSSKNGMILENLTGGVVSKKAKDRIKKRQFNIGISGTFANFYNFLSDIENSAKLIEVEKISFASPEKDEPVSFNLTIKTYSY